MSKKSKPRSRWNKGNKRYPDNVDLTKYHEGRGWFKGARTSSKR